MITEDYVSFETAKLLKEKGFDEEVETLITPTGKIYFLDENSVEKTPHKTIRNTQINIYSNDVSCPTLQMSMKWLREVHNLHIVIKPLVAGNYAIYIYHNSHKECLGSDITYEKSVEYAIKYCLENLI